jgi:uncharacterized membrane protein YozB (DUF420 family)
MTSKFEGKCAFNLSVVRQSLAFVLFANALYLIESKKVKSFLPAKFKGFILLISKLFLILYLGKRDFDLIFFF